jgi:hypothetical protein
LSETCQKCGKPASKYFTVYNPYNYSYFDVKVCDQCYSDYAPAVKKSGEVVWKRTKPVKTYILFTIIGSRGRLRNYPVCWTGLRAHGLHGSTSGSPHT